ncbi:hypothetical protein N474_07345 [Pseudoalteromonas luteoviolacea CPMOR-2]|uniref:Uncharacterized protein n=1 Tax=Pseudoalteromonas luteoviolacea DSM 6061 TaxID=1365250 RepID=A0A166WD36_9GAMM|nr:hypothetical protein [Pseudoalteromonas luteoviolacea]KZN37246.1 hypothetical protein N475_16255 [Pseudoalteromonas luteoviolacea DSM 6061]KZN59502.1 hypothetical protein N474_07345 [Pseudoalteromonas luteoviolacea CPMOR-2]MBE0387533.1 hypothetical protein [Pseudoalteromonas luteoviolacea DSM 6061]
MIVKTLKALSVICFFSMFTAYAAMPKSQIWLAKESKDGFVVKPLTTPDAYHNQPLVTDKGVYYTKELMDKQQTQTDLFFYSFTEKAHVNLTNTPVSEYSPTLYPHGDGVSAVVVEPSGEQKLWFYPSDDRVAPSRIFEHLEPVGYHVWGKNTDVMMFILGTPHTLQFTDLNGHLPKRVASDIGRSLAYNAKKDVYSFTYTENNTHWFATYSNQLQSISKLFALPTKVRDYTWLDADTVAYAIGSRIFTRTISEPKRVSLWRNLQDYCTANITRLSYNEGTLAFVCRQ